MGALDPISVIQIGLALLLALLCGVLLYAVRRSYQGWWQTWFQRQRSIRQQQSLPEQARLRERAVGGQPHESLYSVETIFPLPNDQSSVRRSTVALATSVLAVLLVGIIHLGVGQASIAPNQVAVALLGQSSDVAHQSILWNLRMPRMLVALIAGAMFGLSGTMMQRGTGSPLADLGALGIAAGGAFAIALWIGLIAPGTLPGDVALPLVALVGCLVASLPISALSRANTTRFVRPAFVGVGLSLLFPIASLLILLPDFQLNGLLWWTVGSLERRGWHAWHALWPWALIALALGLIMTRCEVQARFDTTVDSVSHTEQRQPARLWAAGLLAGSAVGIVGAIGYLGLFGSLIARRLVGADTQYVLPLSVIWGAGLLVLADIVAQTISQTPLIPAVLPELPAGLILGLVGLPYVLYRLVRLARTRQHTGERQEGSGQQICADRG